MASGLWASATAGVGASGTTQGGATGPVSNNRGYTAAAGQASTTMYGTKLGGFNPNSKSHVGELLFAIVVEVLIYFVAGLVIFKAHHGG